MNLISLLVVCQGNICRSPMAEWLIKRSIPEVYVTSAGLIADEGAFAADEIGVDMRAHRSRRISPEMISDADLVLAMTVGQVREVEYMCPWSRGRVFVLRAFDGLDVEDPIGYPIDRFRRSLRSIEDGVEYWVKKISMGSRIMINGADCSGTLGGAE
jgi:protein-tyrosine phosphatase